MENQKHMKLSILLKTSSLFKDIMWTLLTQQIAWVNMKISWNWSQAGRHYQVWSSGKTNHTCQLICGKVQLLRALTAQFGSRTVACRYRLASCNNDKQVSLPGIFNVFVFLLWLGGQGGRVGGGADISPSIPHPRDLFYSKLTLMLKVLYWEKLHQVRTFFFNDSFPYQVTSRVNYLLIFPFSAIWLVSSFPKGSLNTTFEIENLNLNIVFAHFGFSTVWKCFSFCKNIVEQNWPRTRVSQSESFCLAGDLKLRWCCSFLSKHCSLNSWDPPVTNTAVFICGKRPAPRPPRNSCLWRQSPSGRNQTWCCGMLYSTHFQVVSCVLLTVQGPQFPVWKNLSHTRHFVTHQQILGQGWEPVPLQWPPADPGLEWGKLGQTLTRLHPTLAPLDPVQK